MDDKTCKRCECTKSYDEFWFNGSAANGGNVCKDCKRLRDAAHRDRNREAYRTNARRWRQENAEHARAERRRLDRELRAAIIAAYGPECRCCGEHREPFLTLDHIGGGGTAHRKAVHGKVYAQLRREGFPPGYRILCWNCNWAYRLAGACPHQEERGRELRVA